MRLLAALALAFLLLPPAPAAADGETSPMLGAALIAGSPHRESARIAGVQLEAAAWWRWIGIALETSFRAPINHDATRTLDFGGSLRVRVMQRLVESLLEPSDVELAVELQGIVERTWWDGSLTSREPYRHGLGLALRFRGSTDGLPPWLIAESRFFFRVLTWHPAGDVVAVARSTQPLAGSRRELMLLVGVGAAFGGGEPRYLRQFRSRPLEPAR